MLRILKEPLVHFLVLGGVLFILFDINNRGGGNPGGGAEIQEMAGEPPVASKQITVSRGQIASLAARFSKVWQRPPSEAELAGLIEEYVRDEVMYRQALEMGLDRDDEIVRRRMRQKLEFFSEDIAALAEPTDEELSDYLHSHPDAFRLDARFSFRQVYFNPDKHPGSLEADIGSQLASLRAAGAEADITAAGDRSLLEQAFESKTEREISGMFGKDFATALLSVKTGSWEGPVESGFGKHLVFVSERIDGRIPALDEVREVVAREWSAARRTESNEALYASWRAAYTVTVEKEAAPAGQGGQP